MFMLNSHFKRLTKASCCFSYLLVFHPFHSLPRFRFSYVSKAHDLNKIQFFNLKFPTKKNYKKKKKYLNGM